jgi:hypothetical protein
LVVEGPEEAANRRGQFRPLIADPFLAAPKRNERLNIERIRRVRDTAPSSFRKLAD